MGPIHAATPHHNNWLSAVKLTIRGMIRTVDLLVVNLIIGVGLSG